MSMQSIRNKQNAEATRAENSIQMQCRTLLRKNVSKYDAVDDILNPTILPPNRVKSTQLDTASLDSVDKIIESLTSLLLSKINDVEFLISSSSRSTVTNKNAYSNTIDFGSFLSQYNSVIRLLTQVGLSLSSRSSITNKLEGLQSPLEAMISGLDGIIDNNFKNNKTDKTAFSYLRALAVYLFTKKCIDRSDYKLITPQMIEQTYNELLIGMSENRREHLQNHLDEDITVRPLSKFPIFHGDTPERIKHLEHEMGLELPDAHKNIIHNLRQEDASKLLNSQMPLAKSVKANINNLFKEQERIQKQLDILELQLKNEKISLAFVKRSKQYIGRKPEDVLKREEREKRIAHFELKIVQTETNITYFERMKATITAELCQVASDANARHEQYMKEMEHNYNSNSSKQQGFRNKDLPPVEEEDFLFAHDAPEEKGDGMPYDEQRNNFYMLHRK